MDQNPILSDLRSAKFDLGKEHSGFIKWLFIDVLTSLCFIFLVHFTRHAFAIDDFSKMFRFDCENCSIILADFVFDLVFFTVLLSLLSCANYFGRAVSNKKDVHLSVGQKSRKILIIFAMLVVSAFIYFKGKRFGTPPPAFTDSAVTLITAITFILFLVIFRYKDQVVLGIKSVKMRKIEYEFNAEDRRAILDSAFLEVYKTKDSKGCTRG